MKTLLIKIYHTVKDYKSSLLFNKTFKNDFDSFKFLASKAKARFDLNWEEIRPINEKTAQTYFDRHYIYHTSWAARILKQTLPEKHIDISSSLFFSGICSAFATIEFYDYRPADLILSNLTCKAADLTKLPFQDNSIHSLSCMHTVEHIGLGRYGDPINPDGDLTAISELKRVLAQGGNLLFVVPLGSVPKLIFNAHRIYSHEQIMDYFKELTLIEFTLIPEEFEDGGLITNPSKELLNKQNYGCGCYWFKK